MSFAQLTYRESLRDIQSCLRFMRPKLYHMGIHGSISKSTLADANENRDWHIYADFAQALIHQARGLYLEDSFGIDLKDTVYALDSTTIDLCLSLFPWARFPKEQGRDQASHAPGFTRANPVIYQYHRRENRGCKRLGHLDPRSRIVLHHGPQVSRFCQTLCHPSGARNVCDPDQIQHTMPASLLTPGRQNNGTALRSNNRINRCAISQGLSTTTSFDQTFRFRNQKIFHLPDQQLRHRRDYRCATLQMPLENRTIFRWIKQHLRIKAFSEHRKTPSRHRVWIAISVYVLVAIIKKQLNLNPSLYTILQILSVTIFDKTPILQALTETEINDQNIQNDKQLTMFNL